VVLPVVRHTVAANSTTAATLTNEHARTVVGHATAAPPTPSYQRKTASTTRYNTATSLVHRRRAAASHATATSLAPAPTSHC
jgi:hypothetical protein